MKTVQEISSSLLLVGIAVFSGAYVFSGALTVLGYIAFGSMLVGSTGAIACKIVSWLPEKKDKPATEKEGLKPQAAHA